VENWTHEEYLAACLQREVSARESHGGEGRIRAGRFPARKSLKDSNQPGAEEDDIVAGGDEVQGSQVGDGVAFQAAGVAISGRVEFELPPHRVPVLVLHTAALVAVLRFRRNSAAFFASKDL
jgi:hypothetical protein